MASSDLQLETAQASPPWAVKLIALFSQSKKVERHQGTAFFFALQLLIFYLLGSLRARFLVSTLSILSCSILTRTERAKYSTYGR